MWSKSVGAWGSKVWVVERTHGKLSLRYGRPQRWVALGHGNRHRAMAQARDLAAALLAGRDPTLGDASPVTSLLLRYATEVSPHKKPPQPREDARRVALWVAWLGHLTVADLTPDLMDRYRRDRLAGKVTVPGLPRGLTKTPSLTTVGADVVFLQAVLNWSVRQRLLLANPLRGVRAPVTPTPRRPVASWDRFQALLATAGTIDPAGRFGAFLGLLEALGWRVTALCRLRAEDVDRTPGPHWPHGRVLKRAEHDKRGVEMWVPLSPAARATLDTLPVPLSGGWLFPSPRDPGKPWRREYARDLLERCEAAAELEPLPGGDFHPYRRKWATERKHLPAVDVMAAGGWRDRRTLERSYQQVDPATMLAVVTSPEKLREAKHS